MLRMTLFLFFYMSLSCSSTSDKIKLDLPFPSNDSPHNNFTVKDPRSPENIDLQEVFNWQKYYKQAPNAKEQKALADSLLMIPQNTSDRLRLARNSLGLGRRQEAKKLYETILYDEPEHFDAQLELAHIYLAEGSTDRAFDYLSSIHKTLEKMEKPPIELNFRYRYALSLAYIQNQNRKKGHDILTELLERDPGFIPAYGALAQSYLEQEKLDVAEFIAKRGLDRGPDEPRLLNTLAVVALRKNRLDECKIWLQRALQKNPDYVPSLINRANLAMQRREFSAAENDLRRSATLEPLNSEVQIAIGLLMKKTGRVSAAKSALEKAVELDPQNAYARYHLATVLSDDFKDRSGALQLFYDVLQAEEKYSGLKNMAKVQIEAIRDSRLYEQ